MKWTLFIPVGLGFAAVLQGGLNRQLAERWGLPGVVLMNNLFLMVLALAIFAAGHLLPERLPEIFRDRGSFADFSWWYWVPGMCGFLLVAGAPWMIREHGAAYLFVCLTGAQMVGGLLWDVAYGGIPLTPTRVAGASLAALGAALFAWNR